LPSTQGWPPPHALPHAPQFCGSDASDAHVEPHAVVPPGHVQAEPSQTCVVVHAWAQAPQFCGSAVVSTQDVPHVVKGAPHEATHTPAWQSGVAPEQAVPHAPQLIGSVASSVHAPPQTVPP
jgi:hypothetical protein